jgi:integrin beta 3
VPGLNGERGLNGTDGAPGKDGADGLGFDDLEFAHDGERGCTLTFRRGDHVKHFAFSVPAVIYRGIWREGSAYAKGDAVTFGGSLWIAKADGTAKPGETAEASRAWQLAVKKGAEGKAGQAGPAGPQGAPGAASAAVPKW